MNIGTIKKTIGIGLCALFFTLCLSLLFSQDLTTKAPKVNSGLGVQVYYDNYTWLGKFRDKNEVYGTTTSTDSYVNTRTVLDTINHGTSIKPNVAYSYSSTTGHEVSISITAGKEDLFSAEAGYTFKTEVTKTISASVDVPKKTRVKITMADIITKSTSYKVYVTPQQYYLNGWSGLGYWDDGSRVLSPTTNRVKEYSGVSPQFYEYAHTCTSAC